MHGVLQNPVEDALFQNRFGFGQSLGARLLDDLGDLFLRDLDETGLEILDQTVNLLVHDRTWLV